MPPTYIGGLLASFLFLDHRNDLLICESCLHLSVLLLGGLYTNLEEFWGLRSIAAVSSTIVNSSSIALTP
jgi:hypothetical protein